MIVVSDTSPLNYLILVDVIHLLPILFQRVIAPAAVVIELRNSRAPEKVKNWITTPPAWLEIQSPRTITSYKLLGLGETAAIALAQEINADSLLMDERAGRNVATQMGLHIATTLGVLELAATKKMIDLPTTIDLLRHTNFYGKEKIYVEMIRRDAARRSQNP